MAVQDSDQQGLLASPVRSWLPVRLSSGEWSALAVGFSSIIATYLFSFLFLVVQKDEWPGSVGEFFSGFAIWDGPHYLDLATHGYQNTSEEQFRIAFFPLFPWLIRLTGFALRTPVLVSALLVANISFLVGVVYFYRLARKHLDERGALNAVLFLSYFPRRACFTFHIPKACSSASASCYFITPTGGTGNGPEFSARWLPPAGSPDWRSFRPSPTNIAPRKKGWTRRLFGWVWQELDF
jgi:hypothetical protein